jgi:hypothetical protein
MKLDNNNKQWIWVVSITVSFMIVSSLISIFFLKQEKPLTVIVTLITLVVIFPITRIFFTYHRNVLKRWGWSFLLTGIVSIISLIFSFFYHEPKEEITIVEFLITAFAAFIGFIITEHFRHIISQDEHVSKIDVSHEILKKLLPIYDTTQDQNYVNRVVSCFDGFTQLYPELKTHSLHESFVKLILRQKFEIMFRQCFIADHLNKMITDIPGYYFINQISEDKEQSLWEFLITNIENYYSLQLLTDEKSNAYSQERLDGERQFIKGRILNGKLKEFKKIVVLNPKNKICLNKKLTKECLYSCGNCLKRDEIRYIDEWFNLMNEREFENKIQVEFVFKREVDYLFDGSQTPDFGIFGKKILGIQRTTTNRMSPFKFDVACDFYFDHKDVFDHLETFQNILTYLCK